MTEFWKQQVKTGRMFEMAMFKFTKWPKKKTMIEGGMIEFM